MNKLLTIGNSCYNHNDFYVSLNSVQEDIETFNQIFNNINYEITSYQNITYDEIVNAINNFSISISEEDNIIIYFSGHGFHYDGHNFIVAKDSHKINSYTIEGDFYQELYNVFDVNNFMNLSSKNFAGNTLIIVDACRVIDIPSSSNLVEPKIGSTKAWQLYATTLGCSAFANNLFTKAIKQTIYRKDQNISDLYASVCVFMENNYSSREYQQPILINGNEEFCIINRNNNITENNYFNELVDIYSQVQAELQNYKTPITDQIIKDIVKNININLYFPSQKLLFFVKEIIKHHSTQIGILDLLINENINSIDIYPNRFFIQGQLSNYYFSNSKDGLKLYDFNSCVSHINSNSKEVNEFKRTYGKTAYLNCSSVCIEEYFTLIINNVCDSISIYIDDHYSNDSLKIAQLHTSIQQIFSKKKSFLISGGSYANKHTFISCLLKEHIRHYQKICELVYLTPIQFDSSQVQRFNFEEILSTESKRNDLISSIKMNNFDWLIIPLNASLDLRLKKEEFECLLKIEQFAKENKIPLIFYTDFLETAISIMHITKQALPFSEYQINLDRTSYKDEHIYITEIEKLSS